MSYIKTRLKALEEGQAKQFGMIRDMALDYQAIAEGMDISEGVPSLVLDALKSQRLETLELFKQMSGAVKGDFESADQRRRDLAKAAVADIRQITDVVNLLVERVALLEEVFADIDDEDEDEDDPMEGKGGDPTGIAYSSPKTTQEVFDTIFANGHKTIAVDTSDDAILTILDKDGEVVSQMALSEIGEDSVVDLLRAAFAEDEDTKVLHEDDTTEEPAIISVEETGVYVFPPLRPNGETPEFRQFLTDLTQESYALDLINERAYTGLIWGLTNGEVGQDTDFLPDDPSIPAMEMVVEWAKDPEACALHFETDEVEEGLPQVIADMAVVTALDGVLEAFILYLGQKPD